MSEANSYKDRIYKLSTGEKVAIPELEKLIAEKCHYVQYVAVGKDEAENAIALIFPNKNLLEHPDYKLSPEEGCFCPRSLNELGRCLTGCIKLVNAKVVDEASKIKAAAIINAAIPEQMENKNSSQTIINKYRLLLTEMHGKNVPPSEEIYFIKNAL